MLAWAALNVGGDVITPAATPTHAPEPCGACLVGDCFAPPLCGGVGYVGPSVGALWFGTPPAVRQWFWPLDFFCWWPRFVAYWVSFPIDTWHCADHLVISLEEVGADPPPWWGRVQAICMGLAFFVCDPLGLACILCV